MRLLALILATCVVLLQWPLWIGKGSWLKVWQIENQLGEQKKQNQKLEARNNALEAEVRDLKTGTDAIEERARNELGMVRQDEVFFQILDPKPSSIAPKPPVAPPEQPAPDAIPSAPLSDDTQPNPTEPPPPEPIDP
ncbi:cell division protein FtsB [Chitinimonas sp. BJB300]|uniref:cell division protein FtsB n=1 Tax=Chitinimonas sp. BJB300 TaxID=1559339 RepID=UPI000C1108A5|nr:cell division protein FtsB [Chitinimonas sp. BJB300]PHV12956.1 cell division protein FtsB [Chitinimonas sp. BJB300]TSJ89091.1 cell division protein FtsB [Chitinimonas sp. BJB300]